LRYTRGEPGQAGKRRGRQVRGSRQVQWSHVRGREGGGSGFFMQVQQVGSRQVAGEVAWQVAGSEKPCVQRGTTGRRGRVQAGECAVAGENLAWQAGRQAGEAGRWWYERWRVVVAGRNPTLVVGGEGIAT